MQRERLVLTALATGVVAIVIRARSRRRSVPNSASGSSGGSSALAAASRATAHFSILVLHNVSKKKNFGELLRSAAAMGVCEVVVVGATKLATHGAQGTAAHLRFTHFSKLADAVAYVRDVRQCTLCGVEITEGAESVQGHPFRGCTAFLMGNEGHGLTEAQIAVCDHFVYIPQHSAATASLNVNAACAVVLHHFAQWAALPEAPRSGFKYDVADSPQCVAHSGVGLKQMRSLCADGTPAARSAAGGEGGEGEGEAWGGGCAGDLEALAGLDGEEAGAEAGE